MKEFFKNLILKLNDEDETEDAGNNNYDLVNMFNRAGKSARSHYDYELDTAEMMPVGNQEHDVDYFQSRFVDNSDDNLENPFLVNKDSIKKLFISSNSHNDMSHFGASNIQNHFSSDTKIDLLGGLTIWQFTSIMIGVLIFIAFAFYLTKKMNLFLMKQQRMRMMLLRKNINNKHHVHLKLDETEDDHEKASVRTSYSTDSSSNHLLSTSKNSYLFNINNNNRYDTATSDLSNNQNSKKLPDLV